MRVRNLKHTFMVIIAAVGMIGCHKTDFNLEYVVTPYIQDTAKAADRLATGVIGYAFYVDTNSYYAASYEEVAMGMLAALQEGNPSKSFDMRAVQGEDGKLRFDPIVRGPVMVTLCDTVHRLYAWRQIPVIADLPQVVVNIRFRPWRTDTTYVEARWTMVNGTAYPEADSETDLE